VGTNETEHDSAASDPVQFYAEKFGPSTILHRATVVALFTHLSPYETNIMAERAAQRARVVTPYIYGGKLEDELWSGFVAGCSKGLMDQAA
jgi:hypothetical protein